MSPQFLPKLPEPSLPYLRVLRAGDFRKQVPDPFVILHQNVGGIGGKQTGVGHGKLSGLPPCTRSSQCGCRNWKSGPAGKDPLRPSELAPASFAGSLFESSSWGVPQCSQDSRSPPPHLERIRIRARKKRGEGSPRCF